jgi:Sec-independent protein translocase protein TatA
MDQIQQLGFPEVVVFCTVAVLLLWGNKIPDLARNLNEAMDNFRGNFRGGPGSPSHPIPADDSKLLNRKIGRASDKSDGSSLG